MARDIQSIKDYLSSKFDPFPIIDDNDIKDSVNDALRKYSAHRGVLKEVEKSFTNPIDLSGLDEDVIEVINIVPDNDTIGNLIPNVTPYSYLSSPLTRHPHFHDIDTNNTMVNWVQQIDFWEALEEFTGFTPAWKLYENKVYLDNFPEGASSVFMLLNLHFPDDPDDTYVIEQRDAYDWVLDYAVAKLKIEQGRNLSASKIAELDVQGPELRKEGITERDNLLKELKGGRDLLF